MPKNWQVLTLLELGWGYCRIEAETGVRPETVCRYDLTRRSNAAKTFCGCVPRPGFAAVRIGRPSPSRRRGEEAAERPGETVIVVIGRAPCPLWSVVA
jgi:hypothetical protein